MHPDSSVLKKIKIITVLALLLLAGYFVSKWAGKTDIAWNYIPDSAIAVLSSSTLQDSMLVSGDSSINIKELPVINSAVRNLSVLDWFTPNSAEIRNFLAGKNITYSFHQNAGNELAVLLFIPIRDEQEENWLLNPRRTDVRITFHIFQDQRITDINDLRSRPLYSYIIKDDILIISKHGNLVEEALRQDARLGSQKGLHTQFSEYDNTENDINLYIKKESWSHFLPWLTKHNSLSEWLKLYPDFQNYHLVKEDENNALTISSEGSSLNTDYMTEWVRKQKPLSFEAHRYISQQTSFLYRLSSQDNERFNKNLINWQDNQQNQAWEKVKYHIGKHSDTLMRSVQSEIFLCQTEDNSSIRNSKIVLLKFENYKKQRQILERLARLSVPDSEVALDQFMGYDLFSVDIPEFPEAILGDFFKGFPRSYITYVDPYLVISNNSQSLRNYLIDFENQLTWSQSPEFDNLLTDASESSHFQLVINLRKAIPRFNINNQGVTKEAEIILSGLNIDNGKGYPFLKIIPKSKPSEQNVLNKTFLITDIHWPMIYDKQLKALQNPVDGTSELLLTDKNHLLFKISNEQNVAPAAVSQLDGPMVTTPFKADFLNIGRQQRILATAKSLYIIDEDENGIINTIKSPSPSAAPITELYMIDGSSESSNGFILKDHLENLYLMDKPGKPVRRINRSIPFDKILTPVESIHLPGRRYFVVTQPKGKVYLIRENGIVVAGFPTDLLSKTVSSFTWTNNPITSQPMIVGINPMGELMNINLNGVTVNRKQLFRPQANNQFKTLFDANSLDWLIVRSTSNRIAILDKEGNELFEIVNVRPNSEVHYHFFGVDNCFISVRSGGYTTLFDLNGRQLGDQPIPSDQPVSLTYQASYNKLLIYSQTMDKIQTWSIKLR